jgi:hypothetical protein
MQASKHLAVGCLFAGALLLAGCVPQRQPTYVPNAEAKILERQLARAGDDAQFICKSKAVCDKAFALTKTYVQQNADMKIQVIDSTRVQTYDANEPGRISLGAVRAPNADDSETVRLTAGCKGLDDAQGFGLCAKRMKAIFEGFTPFVGDRMQAGDLTFTVEPVKK